MELTEDTVQNMVVDLRSRALEVIEESPPDTFHPLDIQRIKTDDFYVKRFLLHHLFDPEHAFNMLIDCLKWRKEYGVNDITADMFEGQFFETGAVYPFTHDKEGHQILMFHVKMHTKDPDLLPDKKRFLVYWFEKLDRESNGQQLTFLFDMSDTGLSNMDMEFVKFVISLLKLYYPNTLAYLLVYELPWILSAAWKLVKTWLSARAVEKIKFVSRQTILDYIDEDQLPISMGGTVGKNTEKPSVCNGGKNPSKAATDEITFGLPTWKKTFGIVSNYFDGEKLENKHERDGLKMSM